jgi:hypothetical protein
MWYHGTRVLLYSSTRVLQYNTLRRGPLCDFTRRVLLYFFHWLCHLPQENSLLEHAVPTLFPHV